MKNLVRISLVFVFLLIFSSYNAYADELDYMNLPNGEYSVNLEVRKDEEINLSMMDDAVEKPATIVVENGKYFLKFKMLPLTLDQYGATGYLGNIYYFDSDENEVEATVLDYYDYQDELSQKYNLRYPKNIMYPIDKAKLENVQETYIKVFVPIMEEFGGAGKEIGTQYATPTIYWDTITRKEKDLGEIVDINIEDLDFAKPKVRKIIDEVGKIVNFQGRNYLQINFFNLKLDSRGYDDGTKTLEYSYERNGRRYPLKSEVIEEGIIGGRYQLSKTFIPIDEAEEIYLYGKFEATKQNPERYEQGGKINLSLLKPVEKIDEELKLEFVKQDDVTVKKNKKDKLPYDFDIGGVLYSPYTSITGDKFRLSREGENVRFIFKKNPFMANKMRNIKYTIDGSEPNYSSNDAELAFSNQSKYYSDSHYSVEIDPFSVGISSKGGDVTLKVKAFDKDGQAVSDTETYIVPFDRETVSEVGGGKIPYWNYPISLNTGRKAALPIDAEIYTEELSDENIIRKLNYIARGNGISNPIFFEINLYSANKPLELNYNGSWNANVCPLAMVGIKGQGLGSYFAYEYRNGNLNPLASKASNKSLSFNISSNRGYYVIGQVDKNSIKNMAIKALESKINEAERFLNSGEINLYSLILEGDIEKAKVDLEKRKTAYICLNSVEKIDRTMKLARSFDGDSLEFYYEKAKVLDEVANEILNKNILTNSCSRKLQNIKENLSYALNSRDIDKIKDSINDLDSILNNLSYNGKGRNVNIDILKEKQDQRSMASNVFESQGRLLKINGKYYLELGLKTMYFGSIRAHLLEIEVFERGIGSKILNITPISKFSDTGLQGVEFYNKKILVDLGQKPYSEYYIRVKNDAMGNARPVARLVID